MSTQTKTTLKTYFETGDKPTQSQFADLIDSMALVTDLTNGIPLNEPIPVDASITVSDIGKLAMLDYDGNIKLYEETQGSAGAKAKFKLTFTAVSGADIPFVLTTNIGEINTTTTAWNVGVTTPEEEAAAFMSYINTNHNNILVVTQGSSSAEVIVEQATVTEITNGTELPNVTSETLVEPQAAAPSVPKRVCIGVIKNVDEQNHTALFEDIIVLQKTTAPSVAEVLVAAQSKNGAEHAMELAKLIAVPTSGGLVRAITTSEMQDQNFIFNAAQNALYFFIKPHADSNKFYCLKRGLS